MKKILNKIQYKINKKRFDHAAREIRNTPPAEYKLNKEIVIVSQVYHNAVDMTLIALKSFLLEFGQGFVELLDDGSLTQEDIALFKEHLPHINITHIDDIDVGKCPKGGCWERLIHISNLSSEAYVLQVDTDTVTVNNIFEVYDYVSNNQAFTIGGPTWDKPVDLNYLAKTMAKFKKAHVQVAGEKILHSIESIALERYCRGCAAFTGFPKGGLKFEDIEAFSMEMEQKLGSPLWNEWGSEQFCSNVMISKCENPEILSWPKYQNYGFPVFNSDSNTKNIHSRVSVLHFIGSNRFVDNTYKDLSERMIEKINSL